MRFLLHPVGQKNTLILTILLKLLSWAGRLQDFDLAHVAASTSIAYVGPWYAFVLSRRGYLLRPRQPLPADDTPVALYLQSLMDSANSLSTIKSASASIAFFP